MTSRSPSDQEDSESNYSSDAGTTSRKRHATTRTPGVTPGGSREAEWDGSMDYSNHASIYSGIQAGDSADMPLGNNFDHQAHTGATASGDARQHNGNVINTNTFNYSLSQQRSGDTLREDGRNGNLLNAAAEGQKKRVEYLLQVGADIDYANQHGLTALHFAAEKGFEDVVELLIDRGADVNVVSAQYGTPLCRACSYGRTNVVAALLKARAKTLAPGGVHGSALHTACSKGHLEVVKLLLECGLPVEWEGPYDSAKMASVEVIVCAIWHDQAECVGLLLDAGASMTKLRRAHREHRPMSLSSIAAQFRAFSVLRLLAARGADLNQRSKSGKTALQAVVVPGLVFGGRAAAIQTLLLLGADGNVLESGECKAKVQQDRPDLQRFIHLATKDMLASNEEQEFQRMCSPLCRAGENVIDRRLHNLRQSSTGASGRKYSYRMPVRQPAASIAESQ